MQQWRADQCKLTLSPARAQTVEETAEPNVFGPGLRAIVFVASMLDYEVSAEHDSCFFVLALPILR